MLLSLAAALCYKKGTWFVAKESLTKRRKRRLTKMRRHCVCLRAVGCQLGSVRAFPFSQNTFLPQFPLCCEPWLSKQGRLMEVKVLINVYHHSRHNLAKVAGTPQPPPGDAAAQPLSQQPGTCLPFSVAVGKCPSLNNPPPTTTPPRQAISK